MKNLIKEFFSAIYNPTFYRSIHSKSLKSIFVYMLKIDLIVSIVATVVTIVELILNLNQLNNVSSSALVVSGIFGVLATFITILLTIFITWILYGWVFGIIILGVSMAFKNKIPYTTSIKTAFYAMSLGVILAVIPYLPFKSWLSIVIPILIVLINLRKK